VPKLSKSLKLPKSIHDPQPWFLFSPRRLRELEAVAKAGNLFALVDAVELARNLGVKPKWLRELISSTLPALVCGSGIGKSWKKDLNKIRRALMHLDRWNAVWLLVQRGVKWQDVWEEAAKLLKKTPARGSAVAINASYKKVLAGRKTVKERHLYYPVRRTTRLKAHL
jgi:hypothetical protein